MPLKTKKKAPLDKLFFFYLYQLFLLLFSQKKLTKNMVSNIQWYNHELRDNCSVTELYVRILFLVLCIER